MKIVALIPFWDSYETNEFRLRKIAGRYLLSYTLEKLNSIQSIQSSFIYSSSDSVKKYLESHLKYTYLERPLTLDDINVSIETVIESFLHKVDADIVILLHPTSPLLTGNSIQMGLDYVLHEKFDSCFAAVKHSKFAWFQSKPLNYDLKKDVPAIKSLDPVFFEQSSLYIFRVESFLKSKHRLSGSIKAIEINHLEGLEVRSEIDYELVQLIVNSGMNSRVS